MNKLIKLALATSLLTGAVATTQACSLAAWDTNSTTTLAGGPGETAPNNFARYQGLCSMQTGGATPAVLNNGAGGATSGPSGEANMVARFYFLAGATTGTIYTTYAENAATTAVYTVSYDGTNVTVTSNDGGTNAIATVDAAKNWHSVEISWAQGGAINLWVDSDADPIQLPGAPAVAADPSDASGTSGNAASVINAAVLGGTAGVIFDAYESRRTTPIGRLLRGDGNGDGARSLGDALDILNEALSPTAVIANGTADTNESGGLVAFQDALDALNLFLTNSL